MTDLGDMARNVSCWASFLVVSSSLAVVSWDGGVSGYNGSTVLGVRDGLMVRNTSTKIMFNP